jgi:hypothetical protein
MKVHALRSVCMGALLTAGVIASGCGSNNAPGSTDSGSGGSGGSGGIGSGGAGGSGGTTASGGSGGTGGAGGTGGSVSDGSAGTGGAGGSGGTTDSGSGEGGAAVACPSGLQDKVTTCTSGTTPACAKACGPNLPAGSAQPNLGTKTCTCSTAGVYECADCAYETTIPACYVPAATPPACATGVANEVACTAACSASTTTPPGPCTITTDAGKLDGCVCVMESTTAAGPVWSCATEWW